MKRRSSNDNEKLLQHCDLSSKEELKLKLVCNLNIDN